MMPDLGQGGGLEMHDYCIATETWRIPWDS